MAKSMKTASGRLIARGYKLCTDKYRQALGLMFGFQKTPLVFDLGREERVSLHMIFVFYPIDVVLLDRNKRVVEILENFMPFHYHRFKKKARYVIELEMGSLQGCIIRLKEKIIF